MKLSYPSRVAIACLAIVTARVLHVRSRETGDFSDSNTLVIFFMGAFASWLLATVALWLLDWALCIFLCCVRHYLRRSLGGEEFDDRTLRLDALFYPDHVNATASDASTKEVPENTQPKAVNQ